MGNFFLAYLSKIAYNVSQMVVALAATWSLTKAEILEEADLARTATQPYRMGKLRGVLEWRRG